MRLLKHGEHFGEGTIEGGPVRAEELAQKEA